MAWLELCFATWLREAVPRADKLAVVAAVDAVADQRPQLFGDRALMLDGEVRDAAACIELVRRDDRLRRTDVDAAAAGTAMLLDRRVRRQRQVGVDLAEKEPGAGAVEEQRVLAAPADPGPHCELHFHHGRRVCEHAIAERTDFGLNPIAQALQPGAQHLVVVAAARIASDVRLRPTARRRFAVPAGVIQSAGDDAQRAGLELPGPRAERAMPRHILHLPMAALREPLEQPRLGGAEIRVGDAHGLEAKLAAPVADGPREV